MQNLDHPLPRGYMVRYRTPQHAQTKKRGFPTKRAAEAFANTVEVEKLTGNYVAPSLAQVTVGELGKEWLAQQRTIRPVGRQGWNRCGVSMSNHTRVMRGCPHSLTSTQLPIRRQWHRITPVTIARYG